MQTKACAKRRCQRQRPLLTMKKLVSDKLLSRIRHSNSNNNNKGTRCSKTAILKATHSMTAIKHLRKFFMDPFPEYICRAVRNPNTYQVFRWETHQRKISSASDSRTFTSSSLTQISGRSELLGGPSSEWTDFCVAFK